jgi:protein arginine N-methyltransferase 1
LFIACIEDADYKDEKIECKCLSYRLVVVSQCLDWNNVYGFDFSCIQAMAYREPLVDSVNSDSVVTTASKILVMFHCFF